MSSSEADSGRADRVQAALARAGCVVLDFDGPLFRLFSDRNEGGSVAPRIAADLLAVLASHGLELGELKECRDPHHILRRVAEEARLSGGTGGWAAASAEVAAELLRREVESAEHSAMTPGADLFLTAWRAAGGHLSISSNNAEPAVRRALERKSLLDFFDGPIVGRPGDPLLMKPNPGALLAALWEGADDIDAHLMIGDSVSDLVVARKVGMPFLGYHRKHRKRELLRAAGAEVVVATMTELAAAVPGSVLSGSVLSGSAP